MEVSSCSVRSVHPDGPCPVPVEIRRHAPERPWTYQLLDKRQREIAARSLKGQPGALLLSEVAPVITMGRRTPEQDLLVTPRHLEARGVDVIRIDRGGLATYHGPGQWVVFVVDRLEALTGDNRGVRKAVEGLLGVGLTVCRAYDASAEIRTGAHTGVWSKRGKLASVGVHIEDRVLLHGLAINVFSTKTSFLGIRPCGLDEPVAFLNQTSGDGQPLFAEVAKRIEECVFDRFWL